MNKKQRSFQVVEVQNGFVIQDAGNSPVTRTWIAETLREVAAVLALLESEKAEDAVQVS